MPAHASSRHAPARIGVLASGGGSNLQAILEYFREHPGVADVVLVASNKAEAGALDRARAAGIAADVVSPADGAAMRALFDAHRVDLVVLAGYLKLLPAAVTRAWHGRVLNVHPALLPSFGGPGMYGRRVHAAVIASGALVSGATVHFVDELYDRGPIAAQETVAVIPGDTPETLAARVLALEHHLYPRVIADVATGRIRLADDGHVVGALIGTASL